MDGNLLQMAREAGLIFGEPFGMEHLASFAELVRSDFAEALKDPVAVRANILRGTIVIPGDLVFLHDSSGPVAMMVEDAVSAERKECAKVCFDARNHPDITPITLGNRILERGRCSRCKGRGYTDEGDPEVGSALFECDNCGGTGRDRGKQEKV